MKKWIMMTALILLIAAALPAQAVRLIGGLDRLPVMSEEEAANLPLEAAGPVVLTFEGEKLPYDASSNTYLIPQNVRSEAFEGKITLEAEEGYTYAVLQPAFQDKTDAMQNSIALTVVGTKEDTCFVSNILFTSLPVLCLDTDSRQLPQSEDETGYLRLFSVHDGRFAVERTPLEINERGNTSRRFPKRSYRLQLLDDRGEKRNLSIAGLRSDDDWILNPMYTDTSKVREKLAYELWEQINTSGMHAASSRIEYAEVFFGEKYWGLYGVQERIDNKQVSGSKKADVLYKVVANDRPTTEELLSWEDRLMCKAFEAQYGDEYRGSTQQLWTPAASYMMMLGGGEAIGECKVSLENAIDYGIWAMLVQAHDCHFKNQFLNCVYDDGGYTMYKIPWDTNHTFGDVWRGEEPERNYSGYVLGDVVLDGYFEQLIARGDEDVYGAIQARWAHLRSDFVTQESIMARAQQLYRGIFPALLRDSERWIECGMGDGNAMNILDIETYLEQAIPLLDEYIANLGTQEEASK